MLSNHRVLKSLHFSYSYQSVFCKERCVYFESTTFTVSSSFSSMHLCPPTKGDFVASHKGGTTSLSIRFWPRNFRIVQLLFKPCPISVRYC